MFLTNMILANSINLHICKKETTVPLISNSFTGDIYKYIQRKNNNK